MAGDKPEANDSTETKPPHSGIPEANFLEDVDTFMKLEENNENAETVLQRLDEQHKKYKCMESNLICKRRRLKNQIPDIKSSLDMVHYLQQKKGTSDVIDTRFLLSEQVYAKAQIKPTDKVCLWLGANVMLEYSLDEAEKLLNTNLKLSTTTLENVDGDLDFLRDQCTTVEVNMARVYNWDVKRRQSAKIHS